MNIKIVIFSNNKEFAEYFAISIKREFKCIFDREIVVINDIEKLNKIKDINILIYLINKSETQKYSNEDLKGIADKIVVLDKEQKTIQNGKIKKEIGKYEDDRAIIFSILYDYYLELQKNRDNLNNF